MDYTLSRNCKDAPCDVYGHGSHVIGIMVGSEERITVGVAPEAEFIVCSPHPYEDPVPWTK